jgi:hypothetical protein
VRVKLPDGTALSYEVESAEQNADGSKSVAIRRAGSKP